MRPHPYLRAYMAGLVVPSLVLLAAIMVFATARYGAGLDLPIERALIFPLAVVPNTWGAWNMLHMAARGGAQLSIGAHGALLPLLLMPAGTWLANRLGVFDIELQYVVMAAPVAMAMYYLIWKHIVGFINRELGIA